MTMLMRMLAIAGASSLLLLGNSAMADTACNGVVSGKVKGTIVVNAGDFCVLGGANVSGGVRVNPGGVLIVCASTINGGVVSDGALNILLGAGEDEKPAGVDCPGNVIHGGVHISNTGPGILQPAPSIAVERATVSGAVVLTGNQGPIVVANDTISGGLVCRDNAFSLDDEGQASFITGGVQCTFGP